jgi:hypothetical protein
LSRACLAPLSKQFSMNIVILSVSVTCRSEFSK